MATLDQSFETNNGSISFGYDSNTVWIAQQVVIGVAGALDSVDLYLRKAGSPVSGNMSIWIYSDSSDSPGTALSDEKTVDPATFATSLAWKTYVFGTKPSISVGTKVWIVLKYAGDGGGYVMWGNNSSGGYAGTNAKKSSDGSSWSTASKGDANFREYYNPLPNGCLGLLLGVG